MSKYRNKKTQLDGHTFASKAEARRYTQLELLKKSGEITGFMIQPSFLLDEGVRYMADFMVCGADGSVWVEDVKGVETQAFKIKKRLWENRFPWLELRVIK